MDPIEAAILGMVQGLTEFFPVSSSGHLAMLQALFGGREDEGLLFEVAVHLATLIAIAFSYRRKISALMLGFLGRESDSIQYVGKLAAATLPTAVVGLAAKELIEEQFSNPIFVGSALLVTGAIVFSTRWTAPHASGSSPGWGAAVAIGCAQAFAILPGISRSGATVAMALALGVAPTVAAEFSFLLGIIAIGGAALLTLPELGQAGSVALLNIGLGSVAALFFGLIAIWLFVQMLSRNWFHYWAGYCWLAGGLFLAWTSSH